MNTIDVKTKNIQRFGLRGAVVAALAENLADNPRAKPFLMPYPMVAQQLGMCEKSVRVEVKRLEEAGYLTVVGGGKNTGLPKVYMLGKSGQ
jgi:hypothetical protein